MVVNPSEMVACMKTVLSGRLVTIVDICRHNKKKHRVKGCCSLTAGILIVTAAHAAEEARREKTDLGIPYWRTLKTDGYLNGFQGVVGSNPTVPTDSADFLPLWLHKGLPLALTPIWAMSATLQLFQWGPLPLVS